MDDEDGRRQQPDRGEEVLMNRIAVMAGLLGLALFIPASPAVAKVSVSQGISVDGAPLVVTSQREVYVIPAAGAPAQRLGRVPHRSSPLVSSGPEAWAVKAGRQRGESIRLYRVAPTAGEVEKITPASSSIEGRVRVEGVAGADTRYVYLLPDGRFDRQREEIQPGHLDAHPNLQVLRVHTRGEQAWYLARDREPDADGVIRLWLLHDSFWNDGALRVAAGVDGGPVDLSFDDHNLFLVFESGRALRFDCGSLRLLEDLSPMMRDERIDFFAADDRYYWVGTSRALWRIERDNLDGGPFHVGALPDGFAPLGATEDDIWFGALESSDANPVVAVNKGDATSRSYGVRGRHARFWRRFGRGAATAGEGAAMVAIYVPVVAIGIVTFPIWIWMLR
jgi:hypothetical protein